jgi:acetate kinase
MPTMAVVVSRDIPHTSVFKTGFRGTFGLHTTWFGVTRETVQKIRNYFKHRKNYKNISKYRKNISPAIGNIGVISVR